MKHLIILFSFILLSFTPPAQANASPDPFPDEISFSENCLDEVAASQLNVREATGNNDGHMVENYLASTGLNKGFAWCAAFVVWTHQQCGVFITPSAWSPDLFPAGRTVYQIGKFRIANLQPSDVFGIYFNSKKRIAHVGMIHQWPSGKHFISIEGNTNAAGSREGDGVYSKRRLKSQIYKVSRWNC